MPFSELGLSPEVTRAVADAGYSTYSAVVDVDNPDEKLRPGMTTTITVHTREAHAVSRIPNAALRYRPTPPLGPDGKPILQPPEASLPKGQARLWVLTSDKPGDEKDEMRVVDVATPDPGPALIR